MKKVSKIDIKSLIMIFLIIIAFMLFLDIYTFKGIKVLLANNTNEGLKRIIFISFWAVTGFMLLLVLGGYLMRSSTRSSAVFTWYYYLFGVFLVLYVPKILFVAFHLTEDIYLGISWAVKKIMVTKPVIDEAIPITRYKFLSQMGIVLAALPFVSFIYGMVRGRFNFRVENQLLAFPNLPASFNGLKIVHISDIHIGSFKGFEGQVEGAVDMINAQQPDIIFFTGDLVNNFAEELDGWVPILARMKARVGKYSILGNHDYGNYYKWASETEKAENFRKIVGAHEKMGFQLLKNQSVTLTKNDEKIAIIGVENWGHPPFPQYADFDKASSGVNGVPFKILLSHDPTHWDAKIIGKTDIDLTLSGHTHGMQFGFKFAGMEWSPAQYKFRRWAGLYQEKKQLLYVNRGFGYIGYPGRVGMPPEITVLELSKSS